MNRTLNTRLRKLVAAVALASSATGVAVATTATGASASSWDDTYTASFLGGAHQAYVDFTGQGIYGYINVRDGAGDSFCTAIEYRPTFTSSWTRTAAFCGGRSGAVNFSIPGWTGSVDFRAVTGNHVGMAITCWNGTDDVNRDGIRDFCS